MRQAGSTPPGGENFPQATLLQDCYENLLGTALARGRLVTVWRSEVNARRDGAPKRATRRTAFALIVALAALAFVTLLTLSLMVTVQTEQAAATARQQLADGREAAPLGLALALGQLQAAAGPDRRATGTAEVLGAGVALPTSRAWTGVWDTVEATATPTWLVSGENPDPRQPWSEADSIEILSEAEAGPGGAVRVPLQRLSDTLAVAWWVADEGVKADLGYRADAAAVLNATPGAHLAFPGHYATTLQAIGQERPPLEALFPSLTGQLDSTASRAAWGVRIARATDRPQLPPPLEEQGWHSVTMGHLGLPVDASNGGLRWNLSASAISVASPLDSPGIRALLSPQIGPAETSTAIFSNHSTTEPTLNLLGGAAHETGGHFASGPILTEFKLAMGLFHTRSDHDLRLRYHLRAELWNPFPYPLSHQNQENTEVRHYIIAVTGLPRLSIEIVGQPASRRFVDLSGFTVFGGTSRNTPDKQLIHSWVAIDHTGNAGATLPAGEVYLIRQPAQSEGLVREITNWAATKPEDDWYYEDKDNRQPGFQASSVIKIRTVNASGQEITKPSPVTVKLLPFRDKPIPTDQHPLDYAEPVVEWRNIPFEPITLDLSGSEFSRSTSGSYTEASYNVAYHFRVDDQAAGFGEKLKSVVQSRRSIYDYHDPLVAALYRPTADPVGSQATASDFDEGDWFSDTSENAAGGGVKRVLIDLAPHPAPSLLALRQLPWLDTAASPTAATATGGPTPPAPAPITASRLWPSIWDRHLVTGLPPAQAPNGDWRLPSPHLRVLPTQNGALPTTADLRASDAARHLALRGAFNVNSRSVAAWTAILADWREFFPGEAGSASEPQQNLFPAIFSQPLNLAPSRPLSEVQRLAEALVAAADVQEQPFRSLEEFATSGVLTTAIENSQLNVDADGPIPALDRRFVDEAALFAKLADRAAIRSDTFIIRVYGQSQHPVTGAVTARAWLEARVQRTHAPFLSPGLPSSTTPTDETWNPSHPLGRRFVVTGFRWLDRDP